MATKSSVFKQVLKDLKSRDRKGWETYGKRMTPFDGRDSLWDAYEELLDLAVYMRKFIMEVDDRMGR
jgi:hypothetical protein